jgi:hypothetical protein
MNPKQVREDLQRKYRLSMLRIYMDNTVADKPLAVFTLIEPDGSEAGVLTASLPELGFDPGVRETAYASLALPDTFRVPAHLAAALRAWQAGAPAADDDDGEGQRRPVWLRLSVPLGLLAAVPWEELLQPLLGAPMLRLPYQSLYPRQPRAGNNTVVCFSSPVPEPKMAARVAQFVAQVPLDLARATRFHLFADRGAWPALVALQRQHAGTVRIEVYDPARAPPNEKSLTRNPWLHWIADEMGEGRADVVHFLCHGDQQSGIGALKMASSPTDSDTGRHPCLAEAAELIAFLDHVGAWCAAFTSAPEERSAAGMRMLQTEIARQRPGPLLVHDMNVSGSAGALGDAYRFLFGATRRPPASPAVALVCHPVLVSPCDVDEESDRQLRDFTLDGRLGEALHDDRLPGTILSSQRKLEVSAGTLADEQARNRDSGRVRARALVLDAISDYAREAAADAVRQYGPDDARKTGDNHE